MFNYEKDTFEVGGTEYSLSPFRSWLLDNHQTLCANHFVKAINVNGKVRFTYDWQHIYFLANEYSITKQYINELSKKSSGETL